MSPSATSDSTNRTSSGHNPTVPPRLYNINDPPSLISFKKLCSQTTEPSNYPLASSVTSNIPIYDLLNHSPTSPTAHSLQDEWHYILLHGPGVVLLRQFVSDPTLLTTVNSTFNSIISSEQSTSTAKGDHFAASGTNHRVWNCFQKHALASPSTFIDYYSNPWLAVVASAYLGPSYRITAQVNIVLPGGKSQVPHRDYHLGFQTAAAAARFPKALQIASQLLTLQGGVAHSDMPLASGPTRFLPFSQQFQEGYMAYRLPDFQKYFEENWVSVEMKMGDAVFFNPALFHAAGENTTNDMERSANLLQISCAFGKPMESINTLRVVEACWEELVKLCEQEGGVEGVKVQAAVSAVTEGYPFPTNLDQRPPQPGGMAPQSELDVVLRGLRERWGKGRIVVELEKLREDGSA